MKTHSFRIAALLLLSANILSPKAHAVDETPFEIASKEVSNAQDSDGWIKTNKKSPIDGSDLSLLPVRTERVIDSNHVEAQPIDAKTEFPIGASIIVSIDVNTAQIVSGSVGIIIGEKRAGAPIFGYFNVERGFAAMLSMGIAGNEVFAAYYESVYLGGWMLGLVAHRSELEETGPFLGRPGQLYVGPQLRMSLAIINLYVGYLFKAGENHGGADFILKAGIGFELPLNLLWHSL